MATAEPRTRTGRPTREEAAELDDRLRRAAAEQFLEHGFDATTMDGVARAAGITKRTLYARYPDKEALFTAVVPWALRWMEWRAPVDGFDPDDLPAALLALARAALAETLDPENVRLARMGIAESARLPGVVKQLDSLAWSPRIRAIRDLLERHVATGAIVVDDPLAAAEHFLAMVVGLTGRFALFGIARPGDLEETRLAQAVDLFLRGVESR